MADNDGIIWCCVGFIVLVIVSALLNLIITNWDLVGPSALYLFEAIVIAGAGYLVWTRFRERLHRRAAREVDLVLEDARPLLAGTHLSDVEEAVALPERLSVRPGFFKTGQYLRAILLARRVQKTAVPVEGELHRRGDQPVATHLADPNMFVRWSAVRVLGDTANTDGIDPLLKILKNPDEDLRVRKEAESAIRSIVGRAWSLNTGSGHYCSACMGYFRIYRLWLSAVRRLSYSACRHCQSGAFSVDYTGTIRAVMDDRIDPSERYRREGGGIAVNWHAMQNAPFDFDELHIVHLLDPSAIDAMILMIAADTDPERQQRYRHIPVYIAPDAEIPESKIRLVRDFFGDVQPIG